MTNPDYDAASMGEGGEKQGAKERHLKMAEKRAFGKNVATEINPGHEMILDKADRLILNQIQRNFPVCHRPFLALARRLKLKEREILQRVQRMKETGIIRRIGASFSARAVGFYSTLCAAKVPREKIKEFVSVVNSYPGVTHNYEREGDYNIWFTLIAPSEKKVDQILKQITSRTGIREILNLPALKTFKIAVDFNFE